MGTWGYGMLESDNAQDYIAKYVQDDTSRLWGRIQKLAHQRLDGQGYSRNERRVEILALTQFAMRMGCTPPRGIKQLIRRVVSLEHENDKSFRNPRLRTAALRNFMVWVNAWKGLRRQIVLPSKRRKGQ